MTLLWLLTGSVLANIAIWSGQKMAPSVGMVIVTIGLSLGWIVPRTEYYALPNGTNYHAGSCLVVRDAKAGGERLTPFASARAAEDSGLAAHRCVHDRKRSSTYTAMTPQRNPPRNVKTNSISPPEPVSTGLGVRIEEK